MAAVKQDTAEDGKRNDFNLAVQHILPADPVGKRLLTQGRNKRPQAQISSADGGADVLWIETISSVEEAKAAVMGASKAGLPIVLTLSIDTNGRTMMGVTAADLVNIQQDLSSELIAYGTNCGVGAAEVVTAIQNMQKTADECDVTPVLVAKGNCGIPQWVDGEIHYSGTPELMSEYTKMAIDSGARIIGGCCGTTPAHIVKMRETIDSHTKTERPEMSLIEATLGPVTAGAQAQLRGDHSVEAGAINKQRRRGRSRRRA